MPNPRFSNVSPNRPSVTAEKRQPEPAVTINERTANWASVPGKTQPSGRNAGIKKLKIHPKEEGL